MKKKKSRKKPWYKKKIKLSKLGKKRLKQLGVILVMFLVLLVGVKVFQNHQLQKEQKAFETANHTQFIEIVGKRARTLAKDHDLYASVMVAQAILESDWGKSQLTKEANNLFGIKGNYRGQSYKIATQEDDGHGNLYTVVADFRKYPTFHTSLEDNAVLLRYGTSWNSEHYAGAWRSRTKSYKEATAFLQGRYATDTQYAEKLNSLIEQYQLTRFDK